MSFTVLLLTINMLIDFFFHGSEPLGYPKHGDLHALLGFSYGPLIYLYVRVLAGHVLPGKKTILLYFSPLVFSLPFMILCASPELKQWPYEHFFTVEIFPLLHALLFITLAIRCLCRHERAIRDSYSNIEKMSLEWLRLIIYSMMLIILTAVVLYFWRAYFDVIWLLVALLIYVMSYFAMRRPEILTGPIRDENAGKYQKSSLNPEMLQGYKLMMDRFMEDEKAYLDNELTLPLLAEKVSIPVHHLSQVINRAYHRNLFEFIGFYRIEAAKQMMRSPEFYEQKIIDICFRVGFNTISAFNKAFKKIAGMTATQYRAQHTRP